jgi:hypothetical protein
MKVVKILCIVVLLFVENILSQQVYYTNNFESYNGGYDPVDWSNEGSGNSYVVTTGNAHNGLKSYTIINQTIGRTISSESNSINLIQGNQYRVSAWIRGNAPIDVYLKTKEGNYFAGQGYTGSGNWEYIQSTGTMPIGSSGGIIEFKTSSSGTFYIDEIKIENVETNGYTYYEDFESYGDGQDPSDWSPESSYLIVDNISYEGYRSYRMINYYNGETVWSGSSYINLVGGYKYRLGVWVKGNAPVNVILQTTDTWQDFARTEKMNSQIKNT